MNKKKLWKVATLVVFTYLSLSLMPEVRLAGLLVDAIGLDLLLLLFQAQLTSIVYPVYLQFIQPFLSKCIRFTEKFDPLFFIPSSNQLKALPSIAIHAFPCLIATSFWLVTQTSLHGYRGA